MPLLFQTLVSSVLSLLDFLPDPLSNPYTPTSICFLPVFFLPLLFHPLKIETEPESGKRSPLKWADYSPQKSSLFPHCAGEKLKQQQL